jgi:hypothetical protein
MHPRAPAAQIQGMTSSDFMDFPAASRALSCFPSLSFLSPRWPLGILVRLHTHSAVVVLKELAPLIRLSREPPDNQSGGATKAHRSRLPLLSRCRSAPAEAFCFARRALVGGELLGRVSQEHREQALLATSLAAVRMGERPLCKTGCCVRPGAVHTARLSVFVGELLLQ